MGKYTLHKGIQHCELAMPETAAHPQSRQPRRPTGCGICTVTLGMDVGGGPQKKKRRYSSRNAIWRTIRKVLGKYKYDTIKMQTER